jgi:uncharacterized caspase-like protein
MGITMSTQKPASKRRRIVKLAALAVSMMAFGFGVHAAVEQFAPAADAASAPVASPFRNDVRSGTRIALVIGNSGYPDASDPLIQPRNDARALAAELRNNGFEVELLEDAGKADMQRAIERFKSKAHHGTQAVLSFGGYAIQSGRENFMIPVDASIWREQDVRRDGIGVNAILSHIHGRGAAVKVVILDASRRNPFERRFRSLSTGLAAFDAPQGTLILSSATPGKVAYDVEGTNSLMMRELLSEIRAPGTSAETVFNRTRINVSRASRGEQVPSVSSSLIEDFRFVPRVTASRR